MDILPEFEEGQNPIRISPLQKLKNIVRNNLISTITTTVAGSLLITGVSTFNIWRIYSDFRSTVTKQVELQKVSAQTVSVGQVLSYSVKLSATTGDPKWEKLYHESEPELDRLIKLEMENISPEIRAEAKKTDDTNQKLTAIETEVFRLVRQGQKAEASQLIFGPEYTKLDEIYYAGTNRVLESINKSIQQQLAEYQQELLIAIVVSVGSLPILLASWILVLSAVKDYIRERQAALLEAELSRMNLVNANDSLEAESKNRQVQEEIIRSERDTLEQDIGELLDVVCEIEAGDFTISATVNERATGLVSDTLNRLVESLSGVFSQVSIGAQRVAVNSTKQDSLATDVAENTSAQTSAVNDVLVLTQTVRESANSAATQLADNNQSLLSLQSAVIAGEITIESLNGEIEILQQGSDRIVQQMKALGEFVGLSDRFVYDQTDIATQTQVLALNASLVAARAAEQRDPKQFEAVAREFESIAGQVSQLAQQTNEGLNSLEQRNNQIHRVVADVDGEVQRLGNLVTSFTQGVRETREVFATVQSVTGAVVVAGEAVAQTSKTIIHSADSTARSIAAIATLSAKIDAQSQAARSISTEMNQLSIKLLSNIKVFKLPASDHTDFLIPETTTSPTIELEPRVISEAEYQLN